MSRQKLTESGLAVHSDRVRVDVFPEGSVLGMVVVHFGQTSIGKRLNLLGGRCAGGPVEGVPLNFVVIQEMDFPHGRFGNKVQDIGARSAQGR